MELSKKLQRGIIAIVITVMLISGIPHSLFLNQNNRATFEVEAAGKIPSYTGKKYTVLDNNKPEFSSKQKRNQTAFETYSKLDSKGRCGVAFANICEEIMPTEERKSISSIYPSGWQKGVGYNRCHLIGFQLAGENANEKNLITGTEYFNVSGMLPFENMVADYVKETGNHVLYRVTPRFNGSDLVAKGVQMEAWSVEDKGDGICFNVFVHNVFKNGSKIDYRTGKVAASSSNITIKTISKTYKKSVLKSKNRSFSMGIKVSSGNYSCKKISGSKALSVSTKGKITVKKGTGKGTYTIKVKITAGNKTVTKTVKVKVTDSDSSDDGSGSSMMVWITATGHKYHSKNNCGNTNPNKARQVTEAEAKRMGLGKCSRCW